MNNWRLNYWREAVSEGADSAGVSLSTEAINAIAESVMGAHEIYGEATGQSCIPNPLSSEVFANARLIVHSVNTYPQLVEALRELRGNAKGIMFVEDELRGILGNTNVNCLRRSIELADAALRLAEEGESHV